MKFVWRILLLILVLIPFAHVHAESTERAFANLDLPVAKKESIFKSTPARQDKKDGMSVELRKRKT